MQSIVCTRPQGILDRRPHARFRAHRPGPQAGHRNRRAGPRVRGRRRQALDRVRPLAPLRRPTELGVLVLSVRVIRSIAGGLNLSAETLLAQAGLLEGATPATDPAEPAPDTEAAVRADPRLSDPQKEALLAVYRSYVAGNLRNT